uniref:Uncharacterized protein n=1 Tax=Arundo donax TaxID=35708 RepID=A0A0A9FUB5_ARUDO
MRLRYRRARPRSARRQRERMRAL